jgi:hypothetical protein
MSALEIKVPASLTLTGLDLFSLLNEKEELVSRPIYAQYSMRNFGRSDLRMIKLDDWKLIKRFNLKAKTELTDELFNLRIDPGEQKNLINEVSSKSMYQKLNELMNVWMKDIDDPVLSSSF